jgi:hypothetical protein
MVPAVVSIEVAVDVVVASCPAQWESSTPLDTLTVLIVCSGSQVGIGCKDFGALIIVILLYRR